ncbi:WD domain protein [Fusarium beomiforme]|uniref:WD domain protein n=1 Tax=Fusarium beomiforme TaxID=44412 RepID=A0A9P5A6A1_9HYPO|nr:WD domain protein [Fusarium beomiforme]
MEEVVKAIVTNSDPGILQRFLDKNRFEFQIKEIIVEAAARNRYNGHQMIALLLKANGGEVPVTGKAISAALYNPISGEKILALLVETSAHTIPMTEETITGIARHMGGSVFRQLIEKRGSEIPLTGEVIEAVAACPRNCKEVMVSLLEHGIATNDAIEGVI